MNKRYVFSVYKLTIRVYDTVETTYFTTFKEAKRYAKAYKEDHVGARIVSVKEEKVYSTLSQGQVSLQKLAIKR